MDDKERKEKQAELAELISRLDPDDLNDVLGLITVMVKNGIGSGQEDPNLRLVSLKDIGEVFHVSTRTLHNWIDNGSLPVRKIGGRWMMTYAELMDFAVQRKKNRIKQEAKEEG